MKMRVLLLVLLLALAVFNALYSSRTVMIFALQGIWYPQSLPSSLSLMFVISAVSSGLLHLMVTGVPVALLEKLGWTGPNKTWAAGLWLVTLCVPTFQTLKYLAWF
jgi:hypothetical protein